MIFLWISIVFSWNFKMIFFFSSLLKYFSQKQVGFYGSLIHATSSAFELFHFYYFMRELHRQIVCDNPLTCRILSFLIPIQPVLFTHRNCLNEVRNFFVLHCLKQENWQIFICMFQWWCEKDKALFTARYLRGVRDQQK